MNIKPVGTISKGKADDASRGKVGLVLAGCLVAALLVSSGSPYAAALMKPETRQSADSIIQTPSKPGEEPAKPPVIPDGPIPIAKVDEPVKDFGETWMGPTLTHAFVIKNEGQANLEIIRVKPACGCTVAGEHPKTIEPGKSGEFPFSINSSKLRGKYEKAITITTNDPVNPDLKLKLAGDCKRYVDVLPSNAIFGKIAAEELQERVLKITNNTEKPLELGVDPAVDGPFKFEITATTPGKEFELKVSLAPPFKAGEYRNQTNLTTNVEEQKTIPIVATASIPERLEIQPPTITLNPPTTADKAYVRPIRINNYGKTTVKVLEATVDDPALKVTVNERTEGKAYTVNLDIPANYNLPAVAPKVTIKTDDPEKPLVEIPIAPSPMPQRAQADKPAKPAEMLVGQPAPTFNLTTTEGKPLSNATLANAITVLDFFAPNCGFCKKQLPMLEKVRAQYVDKGVRFVAVSQTMRKTFTDDEVKETLKATTFQGELALDHANSTGPLFQANSYPTMVVLGKSGKVEAVNSGAVPDLETRMQGQLNALIAGKPLPKEEAPSAPPQPQTPPAESMVGKPAATFSAMTTEGKPFSNASLTQAITVADFFAPNCGFCKKQMPRLEPVRQAYAEKGVRFVAVSETMRQPFAEDQVKQIHKDTGFNSELVLDPDNKIGPLFGASGFPTMVVFGKSGKVEAVNVGNIGDLEDRLKGQLDALIAGKPLPKIETPTAEAPAPAPQKRPAEALVGQNAPQFTINTLAGKKVDNADFANHPATVLNFVASNCGFCKKTAPTVEAVRAEYEKKGIRFVNMVQTMREEFTPERVVETFKGAGSNLELAHDPKNTVGPLFQASGFPTMVIVDKTGKIAAVNIGAKPDLDALMKGQLDALIAGKPVPVAAAPVAPPAMPAAAEAQKAAQPIELKVVPAPAPAHTP